MGTFDLGAMLSAPPANPLYAEAIQLHTEIMNNAKTAQENLYQMALGFKKMRDEKLYVALGYQNFEEYCEQKVGFSRRNVYNYISVVENLSKDFVNSSSQIGIKRLTLLSKLSEEQRTEIIENTDFENTTVKELQEEIKRLKADKEQLKADKNANKERLEELEQQVEDFENRPIEVAVEKVAVERVTEEEPQNEPDVKVQVEPVEPVELLAAYENAKNALDAYLHKCVKYSEFDKMKALIRDCMDELNELSNE
ncbi:MAG: hypothetical protein LUI06_02270 [Ruminococcus sp.]|nr:hypothetical protein [Ruminococcus sp.]